MMSNKETLIETLRGSTQCLHGLSETFEGVDMYDDTGHVDTAFFTEVLSQVTQLQAAVSLAMNRIQHLLCPSVEEDGDKQKSKDDGKKLSPEDILKRCTFKDNVLYLPQAQLNKKSYATVKQWVEEAGGKWTGGKVQGFTFDFDATRVASVLMQGKRCNLQQEFQFFETPPELADWLVSLAGDILPGMSVLEPSAGRGAIIKAIHRICPEVAVDYYELMPENRQFLSTMDNVRPMGEDFYEEQSNVQYDRIIANPPFSGNQDIRHVKRMYACLKPGGTVAAITSIHWQMGQEKVCADFRKWLQEVGAHTYEIGEGKFKESGTGVNTIAIVIAKAAFSV